MLDRQCEASTVCDGQTVGQVAAWLEDRNVPSLSPGQDNLAKKDVPVVTIIIIAVIL